MDHLIFSLFGQMWWMVLLLAIIAVLKAFKPLLKGKFGELAVAYHAQRDLNAEEYILFNNLTLADGQGSTTQIDHVLLSRFGIFVIETKNYTGWIFGGEYQKMWTQKIYKNTYRFQNPLHQNYKHIKVLQSLLADIVEPEVFNSIVVFISDVEFKTPMPKQVFRGSTWTEYVKTFQDEKIPSMKLKRIQLCLEKHLLEKSWKTNREHVENLRQRKNKSP